MKKTVIALSMLICACVAFWAYQTSGQSRLAQGQLNQIEAEIHKEREQIEILRAEWAILTRPERLRFLVERNHHLLGLTQIQVENYGEPTQVPYVELEIQDDDSFFNTSDIDLILQDLIESGEIELQ